MFILLTARMMIILLNVRVKSFILDCVNPEADGCSNTVHEGKSCKDLVLIDNDIAKLVDDIELEEGVERVEDIMDKHSFISSTQVYDSGVMPTIGCCSSGQPKTHVDQVSKTKHPSSNFEKIASRVSSC